MGIRGLRTATRRPISDCYALNVDGETAWTCCYTEFRSCASTTRKGVRRASHTVTPGPDRRRYIATLGGTLKLIAD